MRALIAIVFLSLLAGCGFQLRGANQPLPFESMYLGVPEYSDLGAALKRSVRAAGTRVVDEAKDTQAIFSVVSESRDKSILSLNAAGRVREFQLRYRFVFRVHEPKGRDIIPNSEIVLTRDYTFNDSQILAKEQEEALLYRDMQNDLVRQIMRRLALAKVQS